MLLFWNYPTLSKRRERGQHIPSLANSNVLYKAHSVSKATHSTHARARTKNIQAGKGKKKGLVKYITKKLISTVFIWNILKYNNM
jgi:hypothetical protein